MCSFIVAPTYSEASRYQDERWNSPAGYDYLVQHANPGTTAWDETLLISRPSAYITSLERAVERFEATDLTCRIVKVGRYLIEGKMIIVGIEKIKVVE